MKVYLQNGASIGTMCGYGEGETIEEAKRNALKRLEQNYPSARIVYIGQSEICFESEVRL